MDYIVQAWSFIEQKLKVSTQALVHSNIIEHLLTFMQQQSTYFSFIYQIDFKLLETSSVTLMHVLYKAVKAKSRQPSLFVCFL